MACTSCSTGGCGTSNKVGGCNSNGGCSTGGCNRLNVFDWLSHMDLPSDGTSYNIVEVRFKGGRKDFYRNASDLDLTIGDPIILDSGSGHHLGFVSLTGELVKLQMKKRSVADNAEIKSIYRIATDKDIDKYEQTKARELPSLYRSRQIITELNLGMKLSDIEYQADNTKATFFYSADDRVDFRELIKSFASEFKVRVEMKQISLRQEAGRLGGIGVCGRELCCSTWLTDFKNVATSAARYQNLSLNPAKLSGQCGRLKCCLNYELETYMEALKDIPTIEAPLQTEKGNAYLQKTDIFRKIMWFGYKEESSWIPLSVDKVIEIVEMNKNGIKAAELVEEIVLVDKPSAAYVENLGVDIEKIDDKYNQRTPSHNKKKKKKGGSGNSFQRNQEPGNSNTPNQGQETPRRENHIPQRQNNNNHNNNKSRPQNGQPNNQRSQENTQAAPSQGSTNLVPRNNAAAVAPGTNLPPLIPQSQNKGRNNRHKGRFNNNRGGGNDNQGNNNPEPTNS